jgi:hypothetical protein
MGFVLSVDFAGPHRGDRFIERVAPHRVVDLLLGDRADIQPALIEVVDPIRGDARRGLALEHRGRFRGLRAVGDRRLEGGQAVERSAVFHGQFQAS